MLFVVVTCLFNHVWPFGRSSSENESLGHTTISSSLSVCILCSVYLFTNIWLKQNIQHRNLFCFCFCFVFVCFLRQGIHIQNIYTITDKSRHKHTICQCRAFCYGSSIEGRVVVTQAIMHNLPFTPNSRPESQGRMTSSLYTPREDLLLHGSRGH